MTSVQLPTAKVLCSVLAKAEASPTKLGIKSTFLPILQAILPNIYGTATSKPFDSIISKIPSNKNAIVMCSGGLGSVSALWRMLSLSQNLRIYHLEGTCDQDLEMTKRECVKSIALDARSCKGFPLVDDNYKTWIRSLKVPENTKNLSRKSRIAIMIATVCESYGSSELPYLVWGNVQDCKELLQAMEPWGFTHYIPFNDIEDSLFTFCEAENTGDKIRDTYDIASDSLSPSQIFPRNISNLVCSCWENKVDTRVPFMRRSLLETKEKIKIFRPFLAMCSRCSGCIRYMEAWGKLSFEISSIRVGSRNLENREDHRHFENIPTLKREKKRKRGFSEFIADKKDSKDKKKRGKKKKVEEEEEIEEKVVQEEGDDEDEDEEDEEEDINAVILETDDFTQIPEPEEMPDDDEIPPDYEAFDESDLETEKKKKKKKKIM